MTHITFLHGAADRNQAAAQWLSVAAHAQRQVTVCLSSTEQLDHFDRFLWTYAALDFVPHCRAGDPLMPETPIVLATTLEGALQTRCVLNLTNAIPEGYASFDELVEIVSINDGDRLPGRERFRFYREHGHPLDNRDISNGVAE
jgi:DNA polymerase-3 subunit chi